MGRIKRKIANITAVILFLSAGYGAWDYTGRHVEKPEKSPTVVQQEPARDSVLYTDILTVGTKPAAGEKEGSAPVQSTPARAGPEAEKEVALAPQPEPQQPAAETSVMEQFGGKCVAVHDGDTITVRLDLSPQKLTNIRLIGVDTPELEAGEFGETAGSYTRSLLQGQKVKLVYDKEQYDKYGRTLAYIYLEDGTFANARLVEEGYARVMTISPNTAHAGEFEALQAEAQKEQRGIWANPPPTCTWRGERIIQHWYF